MPDQHDRPATEWSPLVRCAGWAALGSVGLTVLQVVLFALWPPVHTTAEVFGLMVESPVLGVISLDGLYIANNVLVLLLYLGLGVVLWPRARSAVAVAVPLGLLQMAAYMASNPVVEMLALARAYDSADDRARDRLYAAGEALLTAWKGTAFLVYYWLGALVLLILAVALLRSRVLGRAAGWWALAAGLLMLVPSTFGAVGVAFALASLVPWSGLCVVVGHRLLRMADAGRMAHRTLNE